MADIGKINGLALASVAKINNVAKANVAKFSGVTKPSGTTGENFKTDDLEIWWRGGDNDSNFYQVNNGSGRTIENQATVEGYNVPWTASQPAYGDHRILQGTSADFTSLTINSQSVGVINLDGSNDSIITRQLTVGDGRSDWQFPYPAAPSTAVMYKNKWYDITTASGATGFTVELWWRSDGSFNSNGNIMGTYNECFRFRINSIGQMVGVGMRLGSSSWNTGWYPSTNTWYQLSFVFDPTLSSNQSKLYVNGALEAQRSGGSNVSASTWIQNTLLIGAYQTGGAEAQHMYVGLFRKYITPLTATEISTNYDADKATFGLT